MANVELKTDFKDGEKLYGPELNNNFKAIKAALETMNKIVWQDEQDIPDSITAFRGTTEELRNRDIIDGQLLYDTNTGETYVDYEGRRISTGSGNAIHIGEDEPSNASTQLWIPTDEFTSVGTEVVNSLEGNETAKAPSVSAVNNKLQQDIITDGEPVKTGRKVNGKDEYVKQFSIGNLPDATSLEVAHNLGDIFVTAVKGVARADNKTTITLPYINPTSLESGVSLAIMANGTIQVITGTNRVNYIGYVDVYFTYDKTESEE